MISFMCINKSQFITQIINGSFVLNFEIVQIRDRKKTDTNRSERFSFQEKDTFE